MKVFNLLIGLSLVTILGGFLFYNASPKGSANIDNNKNELQMDIPNYMEYTDASLQNSTKKGTAILFFAATTWCQTCSALEEEIIERQQEIPANTTILKVDYDNDKLMNQKWKVTSQHTLIVLDKNGSEDKRWLGGGFDVILQELGDL